MTTLTAKPEGATWTDDQWEAIARRDENILVAAAAGSGKTAVLVERIIRRIADETRPLDVDRLLVATFTNAAAAEMRERIRHALENELEKRPESRHLRSQLALLPKASITTLHSFCLEVVRRHHRAVGLDPGFRIANDTEAELMKQELLEELIDETYLASAADSDFWRLADRFSGERGDGELFRLVRDLFEASRSHPVPEQWLRDMAGMFGDHSSSGSRKLWYDGLMADVRLVLNGAAGILREALKLAESPGGPAPYLENLRQELDRTSVLCGLCGGDWTVLHAAMAEPHFGRLKACRGDEYDKELQKRVQDLRNDAKARVAKLQKELFGRTPEQYEAELDALAPLMGELAELVIRFGERYAAAKREKGLVDFSDLEHYCLHVLREEAQDGDGYMPTAAALEYREHFEEVLLDEYQDTNRVQEAIVSLVAKPGKGNRFMVGDVKQSIYRFRLAEPGLFLAKYKAYGKDGSGGGRRIDLARNFRSRTEVLDGVNYLFRRIMEESVGEIVYDESAELVCGAAYPDCGEDVSVELSLIDKEADSVASGDAADPGAATAAGGRSDEGDGNPDSEDAQGEGEAAQSAEQAELETARLEARLIAERIRELMGHRGGKPFPVTGKGGTPARPLMYRDIVILMRSTQSWAPIFADEFKKQGIPVYAELNAGYFTAVEVDVVMSLLKIIDNPYQDIPLAGVLRSPIVGLTSDELARIRLRKRGGSFFDALCMSAEPLSDGSDRELAEKAGEFIGRLDRWRVEARQGSVADLVWSVLRETGYYDFVGGLPGGAQRQANLRALYDRARQYEATSFRGLFRFLRFIARMREGGGDLGAAKALGENEDVVRIMTIHKSKGLEFPVVFAAGMAKGFNKQDLNGAFLLHKDLGFGPKYIDTDLRIAYPSLPSLAIRRRLRMEMLAEEMRVLYVALTRAREKLILTGTVKSLGKLAAGWLRTAQAAEEVLPDYELAQANCYLDWVGPALIGHPDAGRLREAAGEAAGMPFALAPQASKWKVRITSPAGLVTPEPEAGETAEEWPFPGGGSAEAENRSARLDALCILSPAPPSGSPFASEVERRLSWSYPHEAATRLLSKTTVTELKRLAELGGMSLLTEPDSLVTTERMLPGKERVPKPVFRRPRFVEETGMNAAEQGTVYHAVMQQLELKPGLSSRDIAERLRDMTEKRLLTPEQAKAVDPAVIAAFYETEVGQRLLFAGSGKVGREIPFNYRLSAGALHPELTGEAAREPVMIQGIIDCMFEDAEGLVLLDYKTDALRGASAQNRAERYRMQLDLYAHAVEQIWKRKLSAVYLFFFDGARLVDMTPERKPSQE